MVGAIKKKVVIPQKKVVIPQQKIVIAFSTAENEKSRKKALKTAVAYPGVNSATLSGIQRNHVEVIGRGIDAAKLTMMLRKKVGYAELYSAVHIPAATQPQQQVPSCAIM